MIFSWFGRMRSFGEKVTWLVTFTSGMAIIGVSFALAAFDYANLRRETIAGLEAQTMIVAMNVGAPLAFSDQVSAMEALSAFKARRSVALATVFDVNGADFAAYRRAGGGTPVSTAKVPQGLFAPRWLRHVAPIEDNEQLLGRIEVVYDLRELHQHLLRSLALSSLVSLLAVALVYLFSLQINQILVRPIAELSVTARRVSETKDYSLRARKVSDDELGSFTDVFNQMLAQIQKQDLEIQASRAEALHASQLKDEFLATLSHELRTPMTPILGWAQILQRIGRGDPQVLQAAEVIERNARAQNRIVDDLLDMSRIVSGKVRLDIQPIDMAAVIGSALEIVAVAAQARGITLSTDLEPLAGMTRGDPHRLQQVLWNLLSNAIKFTSAGGKVAVSLRRVGSGMEIEVSDTGLGIAPEFLPHVFERFRQADSSNTRHHAGLGLGLAIVKQLVELHGGVVSVHSRGRGLGATFTVALPLVSGSPAPKHEMEQARPVASSATAAPATQVLAGLKLLLVDDEADARELLAHLLRAVGAEVKAVTSAVEALSAMDNFHPHALLSDIGMPGENGWELIRQIRALSPAKGRDIPAMALTAFARGEDRHRALASGFQMHMAKPVEQAELVAAVQLLVGHWPAPGTPADS